jgi:hypothetical protein
LISLIFRDTFNKQKRENSCTDNRKNKKGKIHALVAGKRRENSCTDNRKNKK